MFTTMTHLMQALARAALLHVFASGAPVTVFEDPFITTPTHAGSAWADRASVQGDFTQERDTGRTGVVRMDSGVRAGGCNTVFVGGEGPIDPAMYSLTRAPMVADPGMPGSRWYLVWDFTVDTAPDAATFLQVTLRPADEDTQPIANAVWFGVDTEFDGATNLAAEENVANVTTSSVAIAPGTKHRLEAWQTGVAGSVMFSFDGESPKLLTLSAPFGHPAALGLLACQDSTTASQAMSLDHLILLAQ